MNCRMDLSEWSISISRRSLVVSIITSSFSKASDCSGHLGRSLCMAPVREEEGSPVYFSAASRAGTLVPPQARRLVTSHRLGG